MQDLQAVKTVAVASPGPIVDDAAFTTNTVDTKGFKKARFVVMLGAGSSSSWGLPMPVTPAP